ncbi:MAG: hypothetical protein IKW31_02560 [Alistipes sp.]|nr:hypothetical protein [Alistipes sp.]
MKKFFSMMLIAMAAISMVACSESKTDDGKGQGGNTTGAKLEKPVPVVAEKGDTFVVISWDAIEGAQSYKLNLKGKFYNTNETSYKFENLNAGSYTIMVQAIGEGRDNSEFGSVVVEITGATEVDWFTATAKAAEVNEEEGFGPYNAIDFVWKGTGVKTIAYGLYYADQLIGVSQSEIKAALIDVENPDVVAAVNSEEGFASTFGPIDGGTTYAMCLCVTNNDGLEFFTMVEVATETAEPSEAAKAWIGTWEVKSTQVYSINDKGEGTVMEGADTFTVNITAGANDPNQVIVDGWSVLGEGFITYGEVEGDTLFIMNGTNLGMSQDGSFYYYWLGWYSELIGLSIDAYPSNVVTNVEGVVSSTNKFNLYYEDGTPAPVECYASDVFGRNDAGNIFFLIESFPGVYRTGDMTWTKGAAAAQTANVDVMGFNPTALKSSVVLR